LILLTEDLQSSDEHGLLGLKSISSMSKQFLHAVCPSCCTSFVLKGHRLRVWLAEKQKNPDRKGPYCNYKCSARTNIQKAIDRNKENLKTKVLSSHVGGNNLM